MTTLGCILYLQDGRVLFMDPVVKGHKYMEFKVTKDPVSWLVHILLSYKVDAAALLVIFVVVVVVVYLKKSLYVYMVEQWYSLCSACPP